MLMGLRECAGIWKEALWFGPAAIEAEPINVQHPVAASTRSETLLGLAPSPKSGGVQVRISVGFVMEDSVQ